jgi:hypothetical protein
MPSTPERVLVRLLTYTVMRSPRCVDGGAAGGVSLGTAHGLVTLALSGNEPPELAVADCYEQALRALVVGWRGGRGGEEPVAGLA